MVKSLVVFSLLLFATSGTATVTVPNDVEYSILKDSDYAYILSEDSYQFLGHLKAYNEFVKQIYEREFVWKFNQRADLILTSGHNQIGNGYATVIPNLKTVFFDGGSLYLDIFASKSWLNTLLTHESAHLYQLSAKDGLSKALHTFTGNLMNFPFFFLIHPNLMLPTFILEGNATFNESRWGEGGRLYSGAYRALLLQMIHSDRVDWSRWMNDHIDFPFGLEKYIVGGYFHLYLAQRFGVDTTNRFFRDHAVHWINPFRVNSTFETTFGVGYERLLQDFKEFHKLEVQLQKRSPYRGQAFSVIPSPLHRDQTEVFFLTTERGRSRPLLNRIHRLTNEWTQSEVSFGHGKVFRWKGQFLTRDSAKLNPTKIVIGLNNHNNIPHPDFRGKAVFDIFNEKVVYSLPQESFSETKIYINGKPGPTVHSEPKFGPFGESLYYFVQDGSYRVLMKDGEELTRFAGFDGKIVSIDPLGTVFFIAPSKYGSTLYCLDGSEIYRLTELDTIVDAQPLNETWLLAEVTSSGIKYFTKKLYREPTDPPYFESFPVKSYRAEFPTPSAPSRETEKLKPYSAFRETRFSSLFPWFGGSAKTGFFGQAFAKFADPLEHHFIELGASRSPTLENDGIVTYRSTKNRLNWYAGYEYNETKELDSNEEKVTYFDVTKTVYAGAKYPLIWTGYFSADWNLDVSFVHDSLEKEPQYYDVKSWIRFNRSESYPISYLAARHLDLTLGFRTRADAPDWRHNDDSFLFSLFAVHDLGNEWLLQGGIKQATATSNITSLSGFGTSLRPTPFDFTTARLTANTRLREVKKIEWALLKPLPQLSYYFTKFPISLRQTTPYVGSNFFHKYESNTKDPQYNEYMIGLELELLLFHKIPLRMNLEKIETTSTTSIWQFYMNYSLLGEQ